VLKPPDKLRYSFYEKVGNFLVNCTTALC
jgi:hypothetical protein